MRKFTLSKASLHEVEENYEIQEVSDQVFFQEWRLNRPNNTYWEQKLLDRVRAAFLNKAKQQSNEKDVQMFVLSPLLLLADLISPPFQPKTEEQIKLRIEDDYGDEVHGRIDLLILHEHLWVIVIESKRKRLNVLEALPQALGYMMENPHKLQPTFGFVLNGTEFLFLKLEQSLSLYGLSRLFSLINPGNDLYEVLEILKKLRELALSS